MNIYNGKNGLRDRMNGKRPDTKMKNRVYPTARQRKESIILISDSPLGISWSIIAELVKRNEHPMASQRAQYLIAKLLSNELTSHELDEFLAGLREEELLNDYSDLLRTYFDSLLHQDQTTKERVQSK